MKPQLIYKNEIVKNLKEKTVIKLIEEGFALLSRGEVVLAPLSSLNFLKPPGDCHIKAGYIKHDDVFVIKVATGFYDNPTINLPSGNGLMLLFSQKTGELIAILMDEGYLTDIRTAAAGAIAAKYLAPKKISCIGIIGTGTQAQLQLKFLKYVTDCRDAIVWGRDPLKLEKYAEQSYLKDFNIQTTLNMDEITRSCNLIVTATVSRSALLFEKEILPGTHITAIGADEPGKQELDPAIFRKADIIVTDSKKQSAKYGDLAYAIAQKIISLSKVTEIGDIILNKKPGRTNEQQISIADFTGIAIQDIQIAKTVFKSLKK
jgi:ornithine cyclodeaminase